MVNEKAQLYTIEGIAAAAIMLVTAYVMLNTTTLYTPADTHVTDMQLEQLGNDALAMMDTADYAIALVPSPSNTSYVGKMSPLEYDVLLSDTTEFDNTFGRYTNKLYGNPNPMTDQRPLQWNSKIYYRNASSFVGNYSFAKSGESMTGKEHFVTVTRWVHLNSTYGSPLNIIPGVSDPNVVIPSDVRPDDQNVLLEVLLWRD